MTIQEAQQLKEKTQANILILLTAFQDATGLSIHDLNLTTRNLSSGKTLVMKVEIKAEL